jgi:hypothetical protein|uniref:Uncharacterized protein n=1 Tax=Picea glauca TaxID=3330 RepID=A0A101M1K1_PICGL|nr:hypothetical protein ABT39_MTgene3823 [Picea glauca]
MSRSGELKQEKAYSKRCFRLSSGQGTVAKFECVVYEGAQAGSTKRRGIYEDSLM